MNEKLVALSRKLGLPLVATNDIHYVDAEDAEAQEIFTLRADPTHDAGSNRPLSMIATPDFYMRSPAEMKGLFIRYPEAIENTVKLPRCAIPHCPSANGFCQITRCRTT